MHIFYIYYIYKDKSEENSLHSTMSNIFLFTYFFFLIAFHRLGNVLPHSKRLVPPNLEDKVFQLSIVTASVDFVTFVTPDKLPVYPNVPPDVPPDLLNVTNFVKLAKLSAWPAVSIEWFQSHMNKNYHFLRN